MMNHLQSCPRMMSFDYASLQKLICNITEREIFVCFRVRKEFEEDKRGGREKEPNDGMYVHW